MAQLCLVTHGNWAAVLRNIVDVVKVLEVERSRMEGLCSQSCDQLEDTQGASSTMNYLLDDPAAQRAYIQSVHRLVDLKNKFEEHSLQSNRLFVAD